MTVFKGLYKAVYDYDPLPENVNEELAVKENDILYLINDQLEDGDDGWWLFKKRLVGVDLEEPIGLVPNNYIELLTEPMFKCKALYDYNDLQNEEEEIEFKENDIFEVFDDSDVDWLLVKTIRGNIDHEEYGFIPSNYVERFEDKQPQPAKVDIASFAPPPVRHDREQIANSQTPPPQKSPVDLLQPPPKHKSLSEEKELPQLPNINDSYEQHNDYDEEEAPPPKPIRPTTTGGNGKQQSRDRDYSRSPDQPIEDFQSWNVQEIVNRSKKVKAKLTIGTTLLTFYSENSPNDRPEEWSLNNLVSYDLEKKHLFLELVSPSISLELHTGSSSVGRSIYDKLCDVKGAYSSQSLNQIKNASTVSDERKQQIREKRTANVVVDFVAESNDELTISPGEKVYIINDTNSRDWTLVEKVNQPGKKGLVPSQFIQSVNQLASIADSSDSNVKSTKTKTKTRNYDKEDEEVDAPKKESRTSKLFRSLTGKKSETSDSFSSKSSKLKPQTTGSWKDDASQNTKSSRSASVSSKPAGRYSDNGNASPQKSSKEKTLPSSKKVRSWVDRSATFKVDAELIGASQGKIHLHKTNGIKIAVPAEKLSLQDLEYVEKSTGFSLEKYKPKANAPEQELQSQPTGSRDKEKERRRRVQEREDREAREREVEELRRARELLEQERAKLREEKERDFARIKELQVSNAPAPTKPPRPQQTGNVSKPLKNDLTGRNPNLPYYDWFEFFLKTGVDVNNCQRYTINFEREDITEDILPSIDATLLRSLGLKEGDILRVMKYLDEKNGRNQPVAPVKSPEPTIDDTNWASKPTMHAKKSVDSLQDLLDLKPAATGAQAAIVPKPVAAQAAPIPAAVAAPIAPLDPFKTGGANILPMGIIPMITGGMMLQPSFTGFQPIGRMVTGGMILPVQKTGNGLIPATTFGQTSFATGMPQLGQTTGGAMTMPNLTFGQPQMTGGLQMPNLTFGQQMTGGAMPMPNLSFGQPQIQNNVSSMPQTNFGQPQIQNNVSAMPQSSFGQQMTGGMQMPQSSFGQQMTGMQMPQNSFSQQITGSMQMQQMTGGMQMPQNSFGQQMTGGAMPMQQMTGGFQPQSSFGMTLQRTGGVAPLPQTSFGQPQQTPNLGQQNNAYNQNSQMLQQQPTGFGFGNAPQQTGGNMANLNNASVNNPFGF